MVAIGIVVTLLKLESSTGLNVLALYGAISWVCRSYGKANGRYFSKSEKAAVVFGMFVIDIGLQFSVAALALVQSKSAILFMPFFTAFALVGFLHLPAIYFFVSIQKRFLVRQGLVGG